MSNILAILKNVVGHFSSSWIYCTALILKTLSLPHTGTSITNNFSHLLQNSDRPLKCPKFYTTMILGKNKFTPKGAYFFLNYICDKLSLLLNCTLKYTSLVKYPITTLLQVKNFFCPFFPWTFTPKEREMQPKKILRQNTKCLEMFGNVWNCYKKRNSQNENNWIT